MVAVAVAVTVTVTVVVMPVAVAVHEVVRVVKTSTWCCLNDDQRSVVDDQVRVDR